MSPDQTSAASVDLRQRLGAVELARDVVRITGPDAVAYLQGQVSQNVETLLVRDTAWSFVLQPTGKVDVWCRVTRTGDDEYVVDVDGGWGEALVDRLRRFLLRTRAAIEPLQWSCVALRGPGAAEVARQVGPDAVDLKLAAGWPGVEGYDLLGPGVVRPEGVPLADPADYETLRIVSGVPAMGSELTERTIPAEVGQRVVDASVDFTKGCFTGQELVARIDSRGGNVPRHLRGLVASGADAPPVAATVVADDKEVGTVTSSSQGLGLDSAVALAFVSRAVEPPTEGVVRWDGGEVPATITALPLTGIA